MNKKVKQYCVQVVNTKTDAVVKKLGPMSEANAERVERGVLINLNHEEFHTEIVEAKPNEH